MHALFPDWIRSINPDVDVAPLPLQPWWEAITSFVDAANSETLVDLVRAAHDRSTEVFDSRWRNHLKDYDPVSPLRGQGRRIAVLAAAALIYASEEELTQSHVVQYARRCAAHAAWEPALADVVLHEEALFKYSTEVRTLASWPAPLKVAVALKNVTELIPMDGSAINGTQLRSIIESLATGINEAIARSASRTFKVAADRELVILEQSDILVWLMSGHSTTMNAPWKRLSPSSAAVCSAIELQGLSKFYLGRADAPALIEQAVKSAGNPSKRETDNEQLSSIVASQNPDVPRWVSDLVPIQTSIREGKMPELEPLEIGIRLHDELCLIDTVMESA